LLLAGRHVTLLDHPRHPRHSVFFLKEIRLRRLNLALEVVELLREVAVDPFGGVLFRQFNGVLRDRVVLLRLDFVGFGKVTAIFWEVA